MNLAECKERLMSVGVVFERGLTAQEFEGVERDYGFCFPEDLKEFLAYALPVSRKWIDWRNGPKDKILYMMQWPLDGICFDIEHNTFWMEEWGARPASLADAFEIAKERVFKAPQLIPIYSHRFMPGKPSQAGNPVFSVYQTDIIYYGKNLEDYLHNEFRDAFGIASPVKAGEPREIEFWSDLAG
ncbi:MAG: SMI1/KNR4 family protein [Verrucomicrobia bacterium]|nr:SMI1/KNR4 family protein [Verrucomicrobiota bacterium]